MWELVRVKATDLDAVGFYFKKDYEPFAVSVDSYGTEFVWLRKEVNEIHNQQESDKGTSRKSTVKPKG